MAPPDDEDAWLAYLEERKRVATSIDSRIAAIEAHTAATDAEPGSLRIWLAKGNYFWSLWESATSKTCDWPPDELAMARDIFTLGAALDVWQQGYDAIQYRLSDSHELWDRWIALEQEQFAKTRTTEGLRRITTLFRNRLRVPHVTWDQTSQNFSTFLNTYHPDAYEGQMKEVTVQAQEAKRLIEARDPFELKLKHAERADDKAQYEKVMLEYLDWEMIQSKRNNDFPDTAIDLCRGLYARALCGVFAHNDDVWHEYVVYLSSSFRLDVADPKNLLPILERATAHCPWSGKLWYRRILSAEEAGWTFSQITEIKLLATGDDRLCRDGMESFIELHLAFCGYLKRSAMADNASEESVDLADMGLRSAVEDVVVTGRKLVGDAFQGDPKWRLERILIQYLTEKKRDFEAGRKVWQDLAAKPMLADSYDFWLRYYMWEMTAYLTFSARHPKRSPTPGATVPPFAAPTRATEVLTTAARRRTLDWPERIFEVLLTHVNDHETPQVVTRVLDKVHRLQKAVRRKREQEEADKQAAYAAYYEAQGVQQQQQQQQQQHLEEESPAGGKRKRDNESHDEGAKRPKNGVAEEATGTKRDREHNTVLVTNLPFEVTQTKVRQYFKEYGHINGITAFVHDAKTQSSTALIEFSNAEEASSALLRDGKYLGESQISVASGADLTVYVANYPPAADDEFMRNLFAECGEILSIRWPSLKVNSHRRFCYISFRERDAAAKAVAKEGTLLEDKYRLLAKYSDPGRKKHREGAVAEGREVRVSKLDLSASEDDLKSVFGKYGKVVRVNIPQNLAGRNRGFAFLEFEDREQAEKAAREMNDAKFRSQIMTVEVSKDSKVKATAKSGRMASSDSPAPERDGEGDEVMSGAAVSSSSKPSFEEIKGRTIALLGLPDTVNDARVRAIVDPVGKVVKMVLQPAHGGAKIEFEDAATAGRATLKLDGMPFEGAKLRVGSVEELKGGKKPSSTSAASAPASKDGKGKTNKLAFMPQPAIRRGPPKPTGGPKRGLGFVAKKTGAAPAGGDEKKEGQANGEKAKSNADFKAMFLSGKGEATENGEN